MTPERRSGGELSAHLLRLTHALYRMTDVLPRDEPLRRAIREKAGEIFSAGVAMAHGRMKEEEVDGAGIAIEIMLGYLAMARTLGCANPMNFLVLEREYRLLAETLAALVPVSIIEGARTEQKREDKKETKEVLVREPAGAPHAPAGESVADGEVNDRQKKILDRIAQSRQVKISDLYEDFNGISSKTIQRDLQDLTTRNLIKKEGEKRWTTYMLS